MESSKTCETFSCAHLVVLRWLYAICVLAFSLTSDVWSLKEFEPLTVAAVWKKHLKHQVYMWHFDYSEKNLLLFLLLVSTYA